MSAQPQIEEHEVEVRLIVSTTRQDVIDALVRSGFVAGTLIGECLIEDIQVLWSEEE